ncbi:MAG: PAS domain S-box protein [Candidatus Heimdallarchaeota archaeon]|nr:MAG: PAS domain S-box protein [Candidatus Heimdallarchaeota archaeon]
MAYQDNSNLLDLLERDDIPKDAKNIINNSLLEIKQQSKKLQEDEAKYRSLFNGSPIAQLESDLSDIISYLDQLKIRNLSDFERFIEFNPNEMVKIGKKLKIIRMNEAGLKLFQINTKDEWSLEKAGLPEKGHPHFKHILKTVLYSDIEKSFYLEAEKNELYLHSIPKREGIYLITKISFIPPHKLITIFIDVTPLKEAEERIRESEQKFRRLFEDTPFPLMEFDFSKLKSELNQLKVKKIQNTNLEEYLNSHPQFILILANLVILKQANVAALKLFGIEDISQWSFYEVGGTRFPFFLELLESISEGQIDSEFRGIGQNAEGDPIHVLIKLLVVPGYQETFSKVLISIIDITKLEEAKAVIKQSEQKIRSIIEQSRDGIILLDEEGRVIEWNAAIVQLTEIPTEKAIGRFFWDVYRPLLPGHLTTSRAINLIISRIREVLKAGKASWITRPIDTELFVNGSYKFVQFHLFPIKTQKGFMLGGIWRNITPQKQQESRMKEELLKFNIEDGQMYLIKEAEALHSREVFKDLLRIGYFGLVISRTPEKEYYRILEEEFKFIWMAESALEQQYSSILEKIESQLETLPPKSVILIDQLNFLLAKYGFDKILQWIFKLREIAILLSVTIIISIDEEVVAIDQLRQLEKETREIETRVLADISQALLDILRYVYQSNNLGKRPSITDIVKGLGISRPTIRKRINQLTIKRYLREMEMGRRKGLEMTQKGFNLFSSKESE